MESMIKKYMPYAVTAFAIFLFAPLAFRSGGMSKLYPIALYFIFPATAIVSSVIYCSKFGLDFLFTLIAPIAFIPSMLLYYGGVSVTNIVLVAVYLVSGIFGLFVGDLAFGDKRRKREEAEKAEVEEVMLEAKRRDDIVKEQRKRDAEMSSSYDDVDDFDYSKYDTSYSDEDEIDSILNEFK